MKPKKHLEYYSKVYPQAWRQADQFRQLRGKELPFWPDWCFLPLAGATAIITEESQNQGADTNPNSHLLINDIGIVGALAAWRVTQGVYRFDPDVFQELVSTPVSGDTAHAYRG